MNEILQTIVDFINSDTPDNIIVVSAAFAQKAVEWLREFAAALMA